MDQHSVAVPPPPPHWLATPSTHTRSLTFVATTAFMVSFTAALRCAPDVGPQSGDRVRVGMALGGYTTVADPWIFTLPGSTLDGRRSYTHTLTPATAWLYYRHTAARLSRLPLFWFLHRAAPHPRYTTPTALLHPGCLHTPRTRRIPFVCGSCVYTTASSHGSLSKYNLPAPFHRPRLIPCRRRCWFSGRRLPGCTLRW